jgi:hypothetical protein
MSMADSLSGLKTELMQNAIPQLIDRLSTVIAEHQPVHVLELELWDLLLKIGRQALQVFFDGHGSGELGATIMLPDCR